MNVLLLRWDTKPDKRIRGTFLRPASTRRTSFYAAPRVLAPSASRNADLRVFLRWCTELGLDPLAAGRVDIERYLGS
jgi:hypothetical protein